MIFRPDMARAILDGRKTETRRPVSDNPNSPWWRGACAYEEGRDYALCPGRSKPAIARIRLTLPPWRQQVCDVTDDDARRESFETRDQFFTYLRILHKGKPIMHLTVWALRFELIGSTVHRSSYDALR